MRGPIEGIPALLQPVAHALLQCREDFAAHVPELTPEQIWARPGGAAAIGFHVRHTGAALDRLFTYARGERLSPEQRAALAAEGEPDMSPDIGARLVAGFGQAVENALAQLRATPEGTLLDARGIGRAQIPTTVLGLLFHAAEHSQRHAGQVVTTRKVVTAAS